MHRILAASAVVLSLTCVISPGHAADVKLLTAGAVKRAVLSVAPGFEAQSGDHLVVDNDTAGALEKRIAGGEPFDFAILPSGTVDALIASGRLAAGSKRVIARTGVGVVVKAGAKQPDIRTTEALRQSLLDAKSIAYIDPAAGGSSGVFVANLLQKLGIADQMRAKSVLVPGGLVAQHIADGEAELGIHQISEILAVKGVTLVGPLPDDVQNYTVYAAAIGAQAAHPEAAQMLIGDLTAAPGQDAIRQAGLQPGS